MKMRRQFALQLIEGRVLISEPGVYRLECTRNSVNLSGYRKIDNFNAVTPDMLESIDKKVAAREYQDAVNTQVNIVMPRGLYATCKGCDLDVTMDYVIEDGVRVLRAVDVQGIPSTVDTKSMFKNNGNYRYIV